MSHLIKIYNCLHIQLFSSLVLKALAGAHSAVGSTSDSRARGPGFDARSRHIHSFLLPLIQDRQLSVTGESMCRKYWLPPRKSKPAQEKGG